MNGRMEVVVPQHIEYVPVADFKLYVKSHGAKLNVVGNHYRWVRENEQGELVMILPQDEGTASNKR